MLTLFASLHYFGCSKTNSLTFIMSSCGARNKRYFSLRSIDSKYVYVENESNFSNSVSKEKIHYIDTGDKHTNQGIALPPLVILLGTAQTIQTYAPHVASLSKHRRVIIPELRGQGRTLLSSHSATMEQHVTDFCNFIKEINVE